MRLANKTIEDCLHYALETKPEEEVFIRYADNNKVAVIIETRFDSVTESVIYNFMHFLNPRGFNLLIISYSGYNQIIKQKYPFAFVFDIHDTQIAFDSDGNPIKKQKTRFNSGVGNNIDMYTWKTIPSFSRNKNGFYGVPICYISQSITLNDANICSDFSKRLIGDPEMLFAAK